MVNECKLSMLRSGRVVALLSGTTHNALLTMLKTGANTETLRQYLNDWWVARYGTSVETSRSWQVARHEFIQLMNNLAPTLTNTQRKKLENQLVDFRGDLAAFLPSRQQTINLYVVPACASAPTWWVSASYQTGQVFRRRDIRQRAKRT